MAGGTAWGQGRGQAGTLRRATSVLGTMEEVLRQAARVLGKAGARSLRQMAWGQTRKAGP